MMVKKSNQNRPIIKEKDTVFFGGGTKMECNGFSDLIQMD